MSDPLRGREPAPNDPLASSDPLDPNRRPATDPRGVDPVTGAPRTADTVVVDNSRRSSGSGLMLGVIAAAIVVALLVFMNWGPATDPAATDAGAPAATEGTVPPAEPTAPATDAPAATTPPATDAPAAPAAPATEAPATPAPAGETTAPAAPPATAPAD